MLWRAGSGDRRNPPTTDEDRRFQWLPLNGARAALVFGPRDAGLVLWMAAPVGATPSRRPTSGKVSSFSIWDDDVRALACMRCNCQCTRVAGAREERRFRASFGTSLSLVPLHPFAAAAITGVDLERLRRSDQVVDGTCRVVAKTAFASARAEGGYFRWPKELAATGMGLPLENCCSPFAKRAYLNAAQD